MAVEQNLRSAMVLDALEGVVLQVHAGTYIVHVACEKNNSPNIRNCTLRGNLRKNFIYNTSDSVARRVIKAKRPISSDAVVIGDRVRITEIDQESGVIEEVLPRRSTFARSGFRGQTQTLVTNLDQLVIVFACANPYPDLWRLDRWLVSAEFHELHPLIVANKRDMVDEATFRATFERYEQIGYQVLATSVRASQGIAELREALRTQVSAFTGPSGVGKSSLLNAIQPGLKLATGDVGEVTHKGRHTTTARQLIPLETGGWVADTPGLRQLELLSMEREELADCFVEFKKHLEFPCRFNDCRHEQEPGCNLKQAVEAGEVSQRRYESFLTLAKEVEAKSAPVYLT